MITRIFVVHIMSFHDKALFNCQIRIWCAYSFLKISIGMAFVFQSGLTWLVILCLTNFYICLNTGLVGHSRGLSRPNLLCLLFAKNMHLSTRLWCMASLILKFESKNAKRSLFRLKIFKVKTWGRAKMCQGRTCPRTFQTDVFIRLDWNQFYKIWITRTINFVHWLCQMFLISVERRSKRSWRLFRFTFQNRISMNGNWKWRHVKITASEAYNVTHAENWK